MAVYQCSRDVITFTEAVVYLQLTACISQGRYIKLICYQEFARPFTECLARALPPTPSINFV